MAVNFSEISKITKHPLVYSVMSKLNSNIPEFGYFLTYLVNDFVVINSPNAQSLAWVQRNFDKVTFVFNDNPELFQRLYPNVTNKIDKEAAYMFTVLHEILHLMSGHLDPRRRQIFTLLRLNHDIANRLVDEVVNEFIQHSFNFVKEFGATQAFVRHGLDALVTKERMLDSLRYIRNIIESTNRDAGALAQELYDEYKQLDITASVEERAVILAKMMELLEQNMPSGGGDDDGDALMNEMLQNILERMGNPLSEHTEHEVAEDFQKEMQDLQRQVENIVKNRSNAYARFKEQISSIDRDNELASYLKNMLRGLSLIRKRITRQMLTSLYTVPDIPYERINKRMMTMGPEVAYVMRPRKEIAIDTGINVYIDTSGSISESELKMMLDNFAGVSAQLGAEVNLYAWSSCSEDPQFVGEYARHKSFTLEDFPSCGGTSISPVIDFINNTLGDNKYKNYTHVILTDGWVESDAPVLHPKIASHVIIGLTDDTKTQVDYLNAALVFTFRNKNDKHI